VANYLVDRSGFKQVRERLGRRHDVIWNSYSRRDEIWIYVDSAGGLMRRTRAADIYDHRVSRRL
jgi:hypothetical protein